LFKPRDLTGSTILLAFSGNLSAKSLFVMLAIGEMARWLQKKMENTHPRREYLE
jgi:hypothetical protein